MVRRSMTCVFLFRIKVNWPSSLFQTSLVKYGLLYVIVLYTFVPIVWLMAVWFVWCWGTSTWTIIVQLKWCVCISACAIYFFLPLVVVFLTAKPSGVGFLTAFTDGKPSGVQLGAAQDQPTGTPVSKSFLSADCQERWSFLTIQPCRLFLTVSRQELSVFWLFLTVIGCQE